MSRAISQSYFQPESGPVVTIKPSSPVCPECHSSLNRVPRRFVDRLLSLVYPVHRYHCRSFDCDWEGNLRYTAELSTCEVLDGYTDDDTFSPRAYRKDALSPSRAATGNEPPRRESDTLLMRRSRTSKTKKPNAGAEPPDDTNPPQRAKAAPR